MEQPEEMGDVSGNTVCGERVEKWEGKRGEGLSEGVEDDDDDDQSKLSGDAKNAGESIDSRASPWTMGRSSS